MKLLPQLRFAATVLTACAIGQVGYGATIINQTYAGSLPATISGTLPNQNTALEEGFMLSSGGTLTVYSTSYATGGFQPNLTLFDSAGNYVASNVTPGTSPMAKTDPASGMALDGYFMQSGLAAGQYTLAVTDWQLNQAITATNLSDGFAANYGNGTVFMDQGGNIRTGAYSVDLSTASAATPEPATWGLMAFAFAGLGFTMRKRAMASK